MKQRIVIGSVLALLSVVLLCLSGCEKLATRLRPEIDYELLADMVAERVDERMEMRELQRERERRAERVQETPPAEAVLEVSEEIEKPVEEKSEAQAEFPAADVEHEPETSPVEIPSEAPEEIPLKVLTLAEKVIEIDGIDLVLVEIPAGEFLMGSPAEVGMDHEHPQHRVAIIRPFYLGKYEVTQALWVKVMGSRPSYFKGGDRPVESVSWNDVQKFIAELSAMTGQEFRLPTEAEWEYAARAGSDTRYYFGDDEDKLDKYAWYSDNSENRTHPVGQKMSNQFGLYDMLGNVWEWCADWYDESYYNVSAKDDPRGPASGRYRILRGGAWHYSAIGLRVANRYYKLPKHGYADIGFRIAQDTP
jgi:formylglycine-generating enzyme required for sulfatase activity